MLMGQRKVRRWVTSLLSRVRALAESNQVVVTKKAREELLTLGFWMSAADVVDVLIHLDVDDFDARLTAEDTGEWMYVFKPVVFDRAVYVKLILRARCIVVSFHEDRHGE